MRQITWHWVQSVRNSYWTFICINKINEENYEIFETVQKINEDPGDPQDYQMKLVDIGITKKQK